MAISTTTALIISAVVAAVGAGTSAYSSIKQGEAQKEAAEENAKIAEANARAAQEKAAYDEEMHRERVKKILKSQRALYGASGVDMEGTPMIVQADTMEQGELDALAIRRGGDVAAAEQRSMARLYKMQGKSALKQGYYSAGSSLLGSGSSIIGKFA
jgi:Flp pilus assembly protein TadB